MCFVIIINFPSDAADTCPLPGKKSYDVPRIKSGALQASSSMNKDISRATSLKFFTA